MLSSDTQSDRFDNRSQRTALAEGYGEDEEGLGELGATGSGKTMFCLYGLESRKIDNKKAIAQLCVFYLRDYLGAD